MRRLAWIALLALPGLAACGVGELDGPKCAEARCGAGGFPDPGTGGTPDHGQAGTTGSGGSGGAGGVGGSGGGGGSEFEGVECSRDLTRSINDRLSGFVGYGFDRAPNLENGRVRVVITDVQPGVVTMVLENKESVSLYWPEAIPLGLQAGDRAEVSRDQGWDLLHTDTLSAAVFAEDGFTAPPSTGSVPDGPPSLGFAAACHFVEASSNECGRSPIDMNVSLDLTAGEQVISFGRSAEVGGWRIWNLLATQQHGYLVGDCVVESRFIASIVAVEARSTN